MLRLFRHYFPAAFLFLILIELALFWGSIFLGAELRFFGGEIDNELLPLWPKARLFSSVMFLSLTAMGLYKNFYR